jgi:hypothetical protein
MLFKGKLWGEDFPFMEAPSHVELFQLLAPDADHDNVRGWVFVKSSEGPYWLEVMLSDSALFQMLVASDRLCLDDEGRVSAEFRFKPCSSPNNSPTKPTASDAVDASESFTAMTLATTSTLDTLSIPSSNNRSFDARNKIDPFTRCEISELENVLMLRFGQVSVAVDMDHFERFVLQAESDGKSFNGLTLRQVEFEDGTFHDLTLDWEIWLVSVLPESKALRGSYFGVNVSEKARGNKLRQLKEENPDLWPRITYWVAGFGDSDALGRLEMHWDEGVPPYMSPFYFSPDEATNLGLLTGPSSASLGDALRAKSSISTCAAHDLKPLLEKAFDLDPGFHLAQGFSQKKEAWVVKRKAQVAANKKRPKKMAAPNFGGFGIR